MGRPHPPEKALLFVGLLFSRPAVRDMVLTILRERFGDVLLESPEYSWDYFRYYERELGAPVLRQFVFFRTLFDPLMLSDIKLETNAIEESYAVNGMRRINLDPGYLMLSRVVLASAKDYSHRIYLGKGIYAEVALYYRGGQFNPLHYTYRDYTDSACLAVFEEGREKLKRIIGPVRAIQGCHGV